jgi:hypothetical protein
MYVNTFSDSRKNGIDSIHLSLEASYSLFCIISVQGGKLFPKVANCLGKECRLMTTSFSSFLIRTKEYEASGQSWGWRYQFHHKTVFRIHEKILMVAVTLSGTIRKSLQNFTALSRPEQQHTSSWCPQPKSVDLLNYTLPEGGLFKSERWN